MDDFLSIEFKNVMSQDLPKYYQLNGAIYINSSKRLVNENTLIYRDNIYAYIMERCRSIDIDEEHDLIYAEAILISKKIKN